jgi:pyrimidine-nucleoside phosphorylase
VPVIAPRSGFVTRCDPLELGLTAIALGAGRTRADQKIDPAAGIELAVNVGDRVSKNEPLAWVHAASQTMAASVLERVSRSYVIARSPAGATRFRGARLK